MIVEVWLGRDVQLPNMRTQQCPRIGDTVTIDGDLFIVIDVRHPLEVAGGMFDRDAVMPSPPIVRLGSATEDGR